MNDSRFRASQHTTALHKSQKLRQTLLLYTTSGCHLCEQAEALLQRAGARVESVEIADSEDLLERYGVRIPVVRRRETGEELDWPFDAVAIQRWL